MSLREMNSGGGLKAQEIKLHTGSGGSRNVLSRAASESRYLLAHDFESSIRHAHARFFWPGQLLEIPHSLVLAASTVQSAGQNSAPLCIGRTQFTKSRSTRAAAAWCASLLIQPLIAAAYGALLIRPLVLDLTCVALLSNVRKYRGAGEVLWRRGAPLAAVRESDIKGLAFF